MKYIYEPPKHQHYASSMAFPALKRLCLFLEAWIVADVAAWHRGLSNFPDKNPGFQP
jgi:hypothetical protein